MFPPCQRHSLSEIVANRRLGKTPSCSGAFPPGHGYLADRWTLQISYLVPFLAYAYVAFYGWKSHKMAHRSEASD
jgi:fucose permease